MERVFCQAVRTIDYWLDLGIFSLISRSRYRREHLTVGPLFTMRGHRRIRKRKGMTDVKDIDCVRAALCELFGTSLQLLWWPTSSG